jgi:hypothetical protein
MSIETTFTKQMAAAVANGVAASQSGSAGTPLVLNGSLTNFLSTTASAAVAPGGVVLPVASVAGLTFGQAVTDTSTVALAGGTKIAAINTVTPSVTLSQPVGGVSGVLNGDTIVFPGIATIDAATAANSAIGRRVVLAYTGTDTTFTIVGTNAAGNVITDSVLGSGGVAQSNLDFVTVTSITPVGGGLTLLTAGTNGVGSSPWWTVNWRGYPPVNVSAAVELVSGTATYSVEYTFDDPNNLQGTVPFPLPFSDQTPTALKAVSASGDGFLNFPFIAMRVTITANGPGELRTRFVQAGIG